MPPPGPIVKYVDSFVRYAPPDLRYSFFSWRTALLSAYDVFHVHWPEFLVRDTVAWKRAIRQALFLALILKLRIMRIPVVRTVHNVEPHQDGYRGETRLLQKIDRLVAAYVTLNACTPTPAPERTKIIPHGDFLETFEGIASQRRVGKRVLLFGRIQPYKGVFDLLAAAEEVDDEGIEVRIVGSAKPELAQQIRDAVERDGRRGARVTLDLRTVSDEEMVAEMTRADVIALPYTDSGNGNSGVAMVALSLNRPVLVYRSCMMERLAEETGPSWVQMMDSRISGPMIESALEGTIGLDDDARPRFVGRDWRSVAAEYADLFRGLRRTP